MVHREDTLNKGKWQNQETIKFYMKPDMIILLLYINQYILTLEDLNMLFVFPVIIKNVYFFPTKVE